MGVSGDIRARLRAWFAEHAEADLPTRYEFWGRFTPGGGEPRQRLLHADDTSLRFTWTVEGVESVVEIALEEESATSTVLSPSQTEAPDWREALTGSTVRGVLHTFWTLSIANPADHLEGRAEVYDSLVNPEVGGRFATGGFDLDENPAKIVDLEPGRRMSMSWENLVDTRELADADGKTRLTFVQSGFDGRPPRAGWLGRLGGVAELCRFHERSDWRPTWIEVEVPGLPEGMLTTG
nr:SRPBCC domain-containing protein [Umezawaea beigongshangensis]